jgi:hypothetical protein
MIINLINPKYWRASPSRTKSRSVTIAQPWVIMIVTVQRPGEPGAYAGSTPFNARQFQGLAFGACMRAGVIFWKESCLSG